MNSNEVIVHAVDRNRRDMVFKFLTKGICESSKPAHTHPYGQILPFDVAGTDVLLIGIADNCSLLATCTYRRAVALLALGVIPINFHNHGVVDIFTEAVRNGGQVHLESVCGELHTIVKVYRSEEHTSELQSP